MTQFILNNFSKNTYQTIKNRAHHTAQACIACSLLLQNAHALYTTTEIKYNDNSNSIQTHSATLGFSDPTPTSPLASNPGTTLGEQRIYAFNHALQIISKTVSSSVPITISTFFTPYNSQLGFLATARPLSLLRNIDKQKPNIYYPSALANKLLSKDLSPNTADIEIAFGDFIAGGGKDKWYYGTDQLFHSNKFDFVTVILHEILHGLGFISESHAYSDGKAHHGQSIYDALIQWNQNEQNHTLNSLTNNELYIALTSGNKNNSYLSWKGTQTRNYILQNSLSTPNKNSNALLFAPTQFKFGSSISHFEKNPIAAQSELMEPNLIRVNHYLGTASAVLSDLGWGKLSDLAVDIKQNTDNNTLKGEVFITLQNNGAHNSSQTEMTYQLPSNTTLTNYTTEQAQCSLTNSYLTCKTKLTSFSTETIKLNIQFKSTGTYTHKAGISGNIVESNTTNQEKISSFTIETSAEKQIPPQLPLQNEQTTSIDIDFFKDIIDDPFQEIKEPEKTTTRSLTPTITSTPVATPVVTSTPIAKPKPNVSTIPILSRPTVSGRNTPPVVYLGNNQIFNTKNFKLTPKYAYDPDGTITDFVWKQISGVKVNYNITSNNTLSIIFSDQKNDVVFELTAIDNNNAKTSDQITLSFIPTTQEQLITEESNYVKQKSLNFNTETTIKQSIQTSNAFKKENVTALTPTNTNSYHTANIKQDNAGALSWTNAMILLSLLYRKRKS